MVRSPSDSATKRPPSTPSICKTICLIRVIGILLNLNCDEAQEIKPCIRHELRIRAVTVCTFDIYYPPTGARSEILCRKGSPRLGWHLSPSKMTILIRSSVVFAVSLESPHLFKEPTSLEGYRKGWTPNAFGCYALVPHQFRRDLLARLVDNCREKMKKEARRFVPVLPIRSHLMPNPWHLEPSRP
ncbi:hypothetical protein E4T38_00500 [Aureobasidium subglaciale]|nr:hypothetical protein E4T38_00500 [Aureobasidium subglaciale]KAI5231832.1 hypothetical protein E4T40_00404 [Aureobasidium subglaciale]KAI5234355.1 hypothetical protein E4T41_00499 [Aureobasidium subglaciale]KAI5267956.1 hypothetical protein E4T46_00499 [Aureobasidium subglaciale]